MPTATVDPAVEGIVRLDEVVTDQQLRSVFLDPAMLEYFRRKFPDVADAHLIVRIEEALKFLFISKACHGPIPVTPAIDDIWHAWILQTREYARLCELMPGGTFIHHSSNDYVVSGEPPADTEAELVNDVRMLALYVENFGIFSRDRVTYWRVAAHLVERAGWTIDELNAWLAR